MKGLRPRRCLLLELFAEVGEDAKINEHVRAIVKRESDRVYKVAKSLEGFYDFDDEPYEHERKALD